MEAALHITQRDLISEEHTAEEDRAGWIALLRVPLRDGD